MKLFGINIGLKNNKKLQITVTDRDWVENNFQWLDTVFGSHKYQQIAITEKWFPETYKTKQFSIDNLIEDYCNQLNLDKNQFQYEFFEDIRDLSSTTPYSLEKQPLDCFIYFDKRTKKYKIELAKDILNHPNWLVSRLCYEFTKVKLMETKVEYQTDSDTDLFLYIAAVYFGFGVIIGKNLTNIGIKADGLWETKWNYSADIPYQVIAYALAVFAQVKKNNPLWKKELPQEIQKEFDLAIEHIKNSKNEIFDAKRIDNLLKAEKLFELANNYYESGEINKAISTLEKIINLTEGTIFKSNIYNNIGYFKFKLGEFKSSISDFEKALKLNENHGYAIDNLGFALIMTNNLEKGKHYIEKAMQTENNDNAYSYRNLALYFQKKGKSEPVSIELAKNNFQKAFDYNTPVDLLDFYYGIFLIEIGERERGLKHIELSADLGEKEGIEYLKTNNTKE